MDFFQLLCVRLSLLKLPAVRAEDIKAVQDSLSPLFQSRGKITKDGYWISTEAASKLLRYHSLVDLLKVPLSFSYYVGGVETRDEDEESEPLACPVAGRHLGYRTGCAHLYRVPGDGREVGANFLSILLRICQRSGWLRATQRWVAHSLLALMSGSPAQCLTGREGGIREIKMIVFVLVSRVADEEFRGWRRVCLRR